MRFGSPFSSPPQPGQFSPNQGPNGMQPIRSQPMPPMMQQGGGFGFGNNGHPMDQHGYGHHNPMHSGPKEMGPTNQFLPPTGMNQFDRSNPGLNGFFQQMGLTPTGLFPFKPGFPGGMAQVMPKSGFGMGQPFAASTFTDVRPPPQFGPMDPNFQQGDTFQPMQPPPGAGPRQIPPQMQQTPNLWQNWQQNVR